MSYLETLQRIRQQGSPFEQFTSSFGEAASTVASIAAQQRQREEQERQRRRQQAQQQAEILQRQGAIAFQSGNLDAASRIAQQYQNALREGYDLQPSVEVPLGAPIIQQLAKPVAPTPTARPDFGPEPPGGMATMGPFMREPRAPLGPKTPMMGAPTPRAPRIPEPREVGRVFEGPQVRQDLRSALMMAPTPPIRVGDALYFPDEQRFVEAPQEMRQPQQRMGWVRGAGGVETYRELVPGMVSLPPPRAPREQGGVSATTQARLQASIGARAANAFENFISQVPGAVAAGVVTAPTGNQAFAVRMPLVVNEQAVAKAAALQGFRVSRQGQNLLLEPTLLMAPRARSQRQPQLTPVVAEGGGREWGVKRAGVPIPAPTPRPTAAPTMKGRAQEQEAVGRGWKQYLALNNPRLYEMAYGKGMNSDPMRAMRDPQFARLRAQYNKEVGIEDEDVGDLSIPTRPGQAPGTESGMQKWMRLLEEEERRRQKGK